MRIATNSKILYSRMSEIEAVKYFAKCGFDTLDLGMLEMWDENCPKNQVNYVEYAKELKRVADGCGVLFNQSHAPMHSSYIDEAKTQQAFELIKRSIEIAAIVGVKNIVVHPKQHLEYPENAKILREQNVEFYSKLLDISKDWGINILTENMWRNKGSNAIVHSVCAPPEEFRDYVDMMQSERFGACLDIGHAYLVKEDPVNMINTLGHRIWGLHIHDVARDNDLHTMPFFGNIKNWEEIMAALGKIGYKGDITFEMKALDNIPDCLLEDTLKMLHRVGETFAEMVERNR
ncbi:MAG: sugar phosphate isomerase/epimerase [Clostridia bacterium]|nr:sugar phosphate isomerase/epimerase [Clostridia bacterium]